jgi:hypothetical protein
MYLRTLLIHGAGRDRQFETSVRSRASTIAAATYKRRCRRTDQQDGKSYLGDSRVWPNVSERMCCVLNHLKR